MLTKKESLWKGADKDEVAHFRNNGSVRRPSQPLFFPSRRDCTQPTPSCLHVLTVDSPPQLPAQRRAAVKAKKAKKDLKRKKALKKRTGAALSSLGNLSSNDSSDSSVNSSKFNTDKFDSDDDDEDSNLDDE